MKKVTKRATSEYRQGLLKRMRSRGLLTPRDAAAHCGVSPKTIYTWIAANKLKPERTGPPGPKRRIFVRAAEVQKLCAP